MFIRLTQLNGKPIWFNQDYIVTVEPSKGKGALVVPLGDGLDYEVLESPGAIIEALGGFIGPSSPAVSHKSPSKAAAEPVAAEPLEEPDFRIDGGLIVPVQPPSQPSVKAGKKPEVPQETSTKKPAAAKRNAKSAAASEKPVKATGEKKPRKTVKKSASPKSPRARKKAPPAIPLTEEQLVRLQKMSPGSMRKLVNTLMSQFAIAETAPVVDALIAREMISVTDQGHIDWKWRQAISSGAE